MSSLHLSLSLSISLSLSLSVSLSLSLSLSLLPPLSCITHNPIDPPPRRKRAHARSPCHPVSVQAKTALREQLEVQGLGFKV